MWILSWSEASLRLHPHSKKGLQSEPAPPFPEVTELAGGRDLITEFILESRGLLLGLPILHAQILLVPRWRPQYQ